LIRRLPPKLRTRRGFASLIGGAAFFGYGSWHLFAKGDGVVLSLLAGLASGVAVFLFFWFFFSRIGTGFDD
jgi:hypothetical protein